MPLVVFGRPPSSRTPLRAAVCRLMVLALLPLGANSARAEEELTRRPGFFLAGSGGPTVVAVQEIASPNEAPGQLKESTQIVLSGDAKIGARLSPRSEVFVFLDSDAVPHPTWLRTLVAPLGDPQIGAATGYRWYIPTGAWPSLVRSVWNASALTFLGDHKFNFVWGGSVAMRRETFVREKIAERWKNALSEDYLITQTMHRIGLSIRFVPRCVLPSDEEATWAFVQWS